MYPITTESPDSPNSIFQECDFCKLQGVLNKSIFNRDGWYFCKPCILEIEYELAKRKGEKSPT
jgi:hypothetical protein